jgi:hypothetical protein
VGTVLLSSPAWIWLFDYCAERALRHATIWFAALRSIENLSRVYDWIVVGALRDRRRLVHDGITADVVTARTMVGGAGRGPVLAYWPGDGSLSELDGLQPPALCAVASSDRRIRAWLDTWSPVDLLATNGRPRGGAVTISNPVVAEAVDDLTGWTNHNSGLSDPTTRSYAILIFRELRRGREPWNPDEIRAWAVRAGWEPRHADRLRQLAADIQAGTSPRPTDRGFGLRPRLSRSS